LKQIPEADWIKGGIVFSGNLCGSFAIDGTPGKRDRLPIHLLYRFDSPGTYEVRFNHGEWSSIEILPARLGQRTVLMSDALRNPPTAPGVILSEFLPDILGFPDDESFEIVAGYLYHRALAVRRYAQQGLSYWPDELVRTRLLELLTAGGPSDEIISRLTWPPEFLKAHSSEIIRASLKFIDSDSPVISQGAVRGIGADRPLYSIALYRDPGDLPKLGAALVEPGHGDDVRGFLPYCLHSNFGEAALPYLEAAVTKSPYTYVRTNSAEELVTAGWPAGFRLIEDAIDRNRPYRPEMIQFLRDRFPKLKDAGDARILAFLNQKSVSKIARP
jgi:hypothetical protein